MRAIVVLCCFVLLSAVWAETPALRLQGPLKQGGMVVGKTVPGARVDLDDETVPVSSNGNFVIGFGRDAPRIMHLRAHLPDGRTLERELHIAPRQYKVQRINGLPKRKVTPKPEDLKRIQADRQAAYEARARVDVERTDYLDGFQWPLHGPITGVYGSQRILNGQPKWPHYGVDIAAPTGTPVRAPADGIVTLAHPGMFYSGKTLIMDHGQGVSSTFLHLNKIHVKEGERIEKGQIVAEVGATGRVTGPHLDWRMNVRKQRIDPQLLVPPMPTNSGEKHE